MRRLGIVFAAAMVAAATSGCWLQVGGDATRGGYQSESALTSANVGTLHSVWSKHPQDFAQSPVVWGGRLFVTGGNSGTALSEADGSQLWQQTFPAQDDVAPSFSEPAALNDKLLVPGQFARAGGNLSFDPATGNYSGSLGNGVTGDAPERAPAIGSDRVVQVHTAIAPNLFLTTLDY